MRPNNISEIRPQKNLFVSDFNYFQIKLLPELLPPEI